MGDQRASAGTAGAVNRSVLTIRCFFLWFVLTFAKFNAIVNIISKKLNETVDAEITAMMPLQRACDDENQARNKLSNGPLRAQSKEKCFSEYSATLQADVICRGYVGIPLRARRDP